MSTFSSKYWFILGREKLISLAEISEVLQKADFQLCESIAKIKTNIDAAKLMDGLGGTIKIAEELADDISEEELLEKIIDELKTLEGKIHFGISLYSTLLQKNVGVIHELPLQWGKKIKKILKESGKSVRYVENREAILSSVTVQKNGLVKRGREFLIQKNSRGLFSLAKTVAVQPFEEWGKRDFGRPGRDDKSGMLPPKLARIMVNFAGFEKELKTAVLLDPFCGSGTILTEALLLNFQKIIGSDNSTKAFLDTSKNITWTLEHVLKEHQNADSKLFESDATQISKKLSALSINVIVTEPYLGKPLKGNETKQELEKESKELRELYIHTFTEFYKILKPGGTVVFIIPRFRIPARAGRGVGQDWIRINCAEQIKKSGFRIKPFLKTHEFLLYARENQRVGREIWRFKKV